MTDIEQPRVYTLPQTVIPSAHAIQITAPNARTSTHALAPQCETVARRCAHARLFAEATTIGTGIDPSTDHQRKTKKNPKPQKQKTKRLRLQTNHQNPTVVNGDAMAVDETDEDVLLKRMMGFSGFKSTHNTKVPGNQIYGVTEGEEDGIPPVYESSRWI